MSPARRTAIAGVLAAILVGVMLAGAAPASAQGGVPWWRLNATSAPTSLPLHGEAQILLTASNLGDGEVNAARTPVVLTDELPEGVTPVFPVEARASASGAGEALSCPRDPQHPRVVACTSTTSLPPYERLFVRITVEVNKPQASTLPNVVRVQGGETPAGVKMAPESLTKALAVDGAPTRFGIETYELTAENAPVKESEGWSRDAQAGSHPFQLTSTLDFNQTLEPYSVPGGEHGVYPSAPALPRDLHFKLPPGLVGDSTAVPECTEVDFAVNAGGSKDLCPPDTVLGVATVIINDPIPLGFASLSVPVFNLVPAHGEPARFGFDVENVPVILKTAVPAGGEYAVEVSVSDTSQAVQVLASQLTLWGVPGDRRHDSSRGWECIGGGWWEQNAEPPVPCTPMDEQTPTAFLTLPTSCTKPPVTSMSGDSWPTGENGSEYTLQGKETEYEFPSPFSGCSLLPFEPSIAVQPETAQASTPTGLDVEVQMPQASTLSGAPSALGEADLQETTVTLPKGLLLNPAAANGLQACSTLQFGSPFEGALESEQTQNMSFSPASPQCPDAAKVGTVSVATPLLEHELTGSVYLAAQNTKPFRSPLALYLLAEDPADGIRVKLAGSVQVEPDGQLLTTFENTPQLPFTSLHLHLFGSQRASLSTPPSCGPATTASEFLPWSGEPLAKPEATFQITSGAGGDPCPLSPLAFSPSFAAGPTNPAASAFSPELVDIGRPDGQQAISGIAVHLPPGFAAILASVTPCPEPPLGQEWSCDEGSHIGEVREYAGLGSEPVMLTGQAYLTTGYGGAPFGLLVRTHAAAGPFDLGYVNVRSRINVNPETAAVSVTSDPGPRGEAIPTILRGVPVQLKALEVAVNRPSFTFNPTDCNPLSFTGTLNGSEGAADPVSDTFKAENCASLPFKPTLTASTQGQASKEDGASLDVKVTSAGLGQANIAKVDLQLPLALPSRLSTIQKACPDALFESTPSDPGSACDEDSVIGKARIHTPVFSGPLEGPAYLVSHGGAAFPDVEFVLQGEGVTIVLDGKTDIKDGITYSRFESAPDAPFTSFETELPAGPHSALGAYVPIAENYSLCKASLAMPTVITAQNGAVIEQATKIAVTGCSGVLGAKTVKLTKAQLLAKALKACKTKYKKHKSKRLACEKAARKKYPTKAAKKAARKAAHKATDTSAHGKV